MSLSSYATFRRTQCSVRAAALSLTLALGCRPESESPPPLPLPPVQQSGFGHASASSAAPAHASAADEPPLSNGSLAPKLPQRAYLLASVTGTELFRKVSTGVFFDDPKIQFSAGCNGHFGKYRVEGDTLRVDSLGSTRMGCRDDAQARDSWLSSFLQSRPRFRVDGPRLTLQASQGTLIFLDREVADPDRPLVGTKWKVEWYRDKKYGTTGMHTEPTRLQFFPDGRWTARTPCGKGRGEYAVSAHAVILTNAHFVGRRDCEGEADRARSSEAHRAHDHVRKVMTSSSLRYAIRAGTLELDADQYGLSLDDGRPRPSPLQLGAKLRLAGDTVPK